MNITAEITGIEYEVLLTTPLKTIEFNAFNINTCPSACVVQNELKTYALSKWVSPKRTRSYPYERVYNTLGYSKKITVIPIVKNEGLAGDRDYLQWDTVSLMSLLDVYVIVGYYNEANKHKSRVDKITNQEFDNDFIKNKIREIENYHSSALHWNLKELNSDNLTDLMNRVQSNYNKISEEFKVQMHSVAGLSNFVNKISVDIATFKAYSRQKAKDAQDREMQTMQPKEELPELSEKGRITITNYLGGQYFFTADSFSYDKERKKLNVFEFKHSKNALIPSLSDIKDGLLKMILYTNLKNIKIDGEDIKDYDPRLFLTTAKINFGRMRNDASDNMEWLVFLSQNPMLKKKQKELLSNIFEEANKNKFIIIYGHHEKND
jgi:hypothetical protein